MGTVRGRALRDCTPPAAGARAAYSRELLSRSHRDPPYRAPSRAHAALRCALLRGRLRVRPSVPAATPYQQRLRISSVEAISFIDSISVANSPVPRIPLYALDALDCALFTGTMFYHLARFEAMRHLVEAKLDCPWDSCFPVVSFCFAQDRLARLTLHVSGSSSDIFFPSGSLSLSPPTCAHTCPRLADAGDACARRANFCG
jgi:hypothetical protein